MGDEFKSPALLLDVPVGMSIWDLVEHLAIYARHTLELLPGRIHKASFTVRDKTGSQLTRNSMPELREAVRANHLDVSYFYASVNLAAPGALPWHDDTAVTVWADLGAGEKIDRARVEIESTNKIQADGVHAQMRKEVEHIRQDPELPSHAVKPVADAQPSTTASASWLSRTWRDHTATFVVTVLGGVVVAVLAALLGLQAF
ncbi:hypothetical protein [Microbacterium sp. NPDC087665]|uniref:hypothetical protein n=1 Tax=Microbacterium sp. NPDC087665 TaxID=3364194 RepID=UPI003826E14E